MILGPPGLGCGQLADAWVWHLPPLIVSSQRPSGGGVGMGSSTGGGGLPWMIGGSRGGGGFSLGRGLSTTVAVGGRLSTTVAVGGFRGGGAGVTVHAGIAASVTTNGAANERRGLRIAHDAIRRCG